jgi:hypothetical protein
LIKIYFLFAENYYNLNQLNKSIYYYKKLQNINVSVFDQELSDRLNEKELMLSFSKNHLRDSLLNETKIQNQKIQIEKNETIRMYLIAFVIMVSVFSILLFRRFKISNRQKKEIIAQKKLLEIKQSEILDSIRYAKKIQESFLPTEKFLERIIKDKQP